MSKYLHPKAEERFCTCGAGHGSNEGHVDWCAWNDLEPVFDALHDAINWFTPPNDSKPFPIDSLANAVNRFDDGNSQ